MTDLNNNVNKEDDHNNNSRAEESLGAVLKHAREAKGLSQQEAAVKLHLRVTIVADIEADNFCNIASSTYVRGYVRNYARFLEVDNGRIEQCLSRQVPTVTPATMQSFSRKTTQKHRDTWLKVVTYLIVIVTIALLVLWWVQKPSPVAEDFSKPTVEEIQAGAADNNLPAMVTDGARDVANDMANGSTAENSAVAEPVADSAGVAASAANETVGNGATATDTAAHADLPPAGMAADAPVSQIPNGAANGTANETAAASTVQPTSPQLNTVAAAPANEPVASQGMSQLAVVLSGDCWIKVVDAEGKTLLDGVRRVGGDVTVSGKAPIRLIIGAPQSVALTFNGSPVDLSQFGLGKVARLTLPQA